jgi:hypothetical protein
VVAAALGVPAGEALARVLARQQLLDECEADGGSAKDPGRA